LRRRRAPAPEPPPKRRELLRAALLFIAVVLTVDGLVGDKGFLVTMRARHEAAAEAARLAALKRENARLREEKRRLNEDAETIEADARRQLGLARPGEVMFILKDIRPGEGPRTNSHHWRRNNAAPNPELFPENNAVLRPPVAGRVGLWSKTDSTSYFKDFVVSPK
jgi:cell division protein FtsB